MEKTKLDEIKSLLNQADTLAKAISDENPGNSPAHALRARVAEAIEMAGCVVIEPTAQ